MPLHGENLDKLIEKQLKDKEREKFQEWRRKLDEEKQRREEEERKKQYWMKCPKCGCDMSESDMKVVRIDRCTNPKCQGVYLDRGELEMLLDLHLDEHTQSQLFLSLFGIKGIRKKKKTD